VNPEVLGFLPGGISNCTLSNNDHTNVVNYTTRARCSRSSSDQKK